MAIDAIQVERQVQSAKRDALVVEAADLAIITVRGSDRQSWLNGLLTCDLARLRAGEAAYVADHRVAQLDDEPERSPRPYRRDPR